MQTGFIKGLKPLFIRRFAVLMGICYLLNPLQQQISSVLHSVSHAVEMPVSVLNHSSKSESKKAIHGSHEHKIYSENHEHLIIEFIDLVFNSSDHDNGSDKSLPTVSKVDKHITSYSYQTSPTFRKVVANNFYKAYQRADKGYLKTTEKPPKYFLG